MIKGTLLRPTDSRTRMTSVLSFFVLAIANASDHAPGPRHGRRTYYRVIRFRSFGRALQSGCAAFLVMLGGAIGCYGGQKNLLEAAAEPNARSSRPALPPQSGTSSSACETKYCVRG